MENEKMIKEGNRYFLFKTIFNILISILGCVLIFIMVRSVQSRVTLARQRKQSENILTDVLDTVRSNDRISRNLTQIYHQGNYDTLEDIRSLLTSGSFNHMQDASTEENTEEFEEIAERSGVNVLFLMDKEGTILLASESDLINMNTLSANMISQENLILLTQPTGTKSHAIHESNRFGDFYYYSDPLNTTGMNLWLVSGTDSSILNEQFKSLTDIEDQLKTIGVGDDGFLFAVNTSTNTFIYYDNGNEVLTGTDALAAGLTKEALIDGYSGIQNIQGRKLFCVTKQYDNITIISAASDTTAIYSNDALTLIITIICFLMLLYIIFVDGIILRNYYAKNRKRLKVTKLFSINGNPIYLNTSVGRKMIPVVIIATVIMCTISYYSQTLLELSNITSSAELSIDEIENNINKANESRKIIEDYYNQQFLAKAQMLSCILEENPEALQSDENLKYYTAYTEDGERYPLLDDEGNQQRCSVQNTVLMNYCTRNNIDSIFVYDEQGRVIANTDENWYMILSMNEDDQSYPFRQVLDGRKNYYIQERQVDEKGEISQYIGTEYYYFTYTDENSDTRYASCSDYKKYQNGEWTGNPITKHDAMIQIGLKSDLMDEILVTTDYKYVLSKTIVKNGNMVLFDNSDEHNVVYSSNQSIIGKSAASLNIPDIAFSGNYNGFMTVNGVDYYLTVRYKNGDYISCGVPENTLYYGRSNIMIFTTLISFLFFMIVTCILTLTTKTEIQMYQVMYETYSALYANRTHQSSLITIIMPDGSEGTTQRAASRWNTKIVPWNRRSPDEKLKTIVAGIITIFTVILAVIVITTKKSANTNSILFYIISGEWEHGINIFSLSACVILVIFISISVWILRSIISVTTSVLGTKSETIGHLVASVLKYGSVLLSLFYCLYMIGFDSASLLASAGIMTVVVGLGAQSLISDILAGIFIVFEGEFRVGDIVTIDDFRGQVLDIGLRTTKIKNDFGNIKIYNNSKISGVLNMTQSTSMAKCLVGVSYDADLHYVEDVLKKGLPVIRKKYPQIVEGPVYMGVSELAESSVVLMIIARVKENDVPSITRILNREIFLLFTEHNINIPYPIVSVDQLQK